VLWLEIGLALEFRVRVKVRDTVRVRLRVRASLRIRVGKFCNSACNRLLCVILHQTKPALSVLLYSVIKPSKILCC